MCITTRLMVAAVAAGLGVFAPRSAAQPGDEPPGPKQPDGSPKSITDREFVTKAVSGGLFEIKSAELAKAKGGRDQVKAFADRMIADHTKVAAELKAAAAKAGIPVPSTMTAEHEKLLEALKTDPGFDAAYIAAQVKAHADAVGVYTAAAAGVRDPGLRAFAEKTLPVLREHHEQAKKLAAADGGTRTGRE